jgi:hypothetical protein
MARDAKISGYVSVYTMGDVLRSEPPQFRKISPAMAAGVTGLALGNLRTQAGVFEMRGDTISKGAFVWRATLADGTLIGFMALRVPAGRGPDLQIHTIWSGVANSTSLVHSRGAAGGVAFGQVSQPPGLGRLIYTYRQQERDTGSGSASQRDSVQRRQTLRSTVLREP